MMILLALAGLAHANGGPVTWTTGTGLGGLAPQATTEVRLVSETLTVHLGEDLDHYTATAEYRLDNPGGAATVLYGVPLVINAEFASDVDLAAVARGVRISLDGRSVPCVAQPEKGELAVPDAEGIALGGWCTTPLTIPSGGSVLTLEYTGELLFTDWETNKSVLVSFDQRRLYWPLSPAGAWEGDAPEVEITVDVGQYAGLVDVKGPPGVVEDGAALRWPEAKRPLAESPPLFLVLDASELGRHQQIAAMNGTGQEFDATSALPDQGGKRYGADQANDGKADTAWCEGVDGDGVGQVITVRSQPQGEDYCRWEGLAIIPGYAKSASTWTTNNRVKAVTVRPCGGKGERHEIDVSGRFDTSGLLLPLQAEGACHEVVIEAVERGTKYRDTCISELRLVENCG